MNKQEYNGYTNYETWLVSLWLGNTEYTSEYWNNHAKHVYANEAKEQQHFSRMEDATVILAEHLKDYHEEGGDQIIESAGLENSMWHDLIRGALSEVNWREIAQNLLENVAVAA